MADLIQIDNFINKYNDNLLSENSLLKNNPTVNFSSGTGAYSITNENSYSKASNCIDFYEVQNVISGSNVTFDLGDALEYTILKDSDYIFQFSVYNERVNCAIPWFMDFKLKLYINGVLTETYTKNIDINALEELKYYTFAQSFELFENQVVNFAFELDAPSIGNPNPNLTFNVGGFKLEVDDKFTGLPTPYSLPKEEYNINDLGFGVYNATQYTVGSPLVVNAGNTSILDINGGTTLKTRLPRGVSDLFDVATSKILPVKAGDGFAYSLGFNAKNTNATGYGTIYIDIGTGAKVFQRVVTFPKGANIEVPFFLTTIGYEEATFLANGGLLKFQSELGNTSIYDITLQIHILSKR